MRSSRPISIALTLLAAAGAVSCAAVLGFERLSEEGGIVIDGGIDAADEASIQVPTDAGVDARPSSPLCGEIGLPPEPIDAAAAGGPAVLFAVKLLDFGVDNDGGAGDVPGYNLDRACSPDIASSTCKTSAIQPTFERHAKDKNAAGLDNASFSLIKYINSLSPLLRPETINAGLAEGRYGAVVRVTDWNGSPNDNDVQIEIFPAIGLLPREDPTAGFNADDQWILDTRFLVATTIANSNIKSDRGYISGNKLVARFKEAYFPIIIDDDPKPFDIHIRDMIFTATLSNGDAGAASLTGGTVTGRWKTGDFLGQVRTIFVNDANGLNKNYLCEPLLAAQIIYRGVKAEVCDARDIRSDSNDTARLPCDAVSAAMRIEAYPITNLGVLDAGPSIDPRCENTGDVPAGDDCASN